MNIHSKWITTDVCCFKSDYNDKTTLFNADAQRLCLLKTDVAEWREMIAEWKRFIVETYSGRRWAECIRAREFLDAVADIRSVEDIVAPLETLLSHHDDHLNRTKAIFTRMLMLAYAKGFILFPIGMALNVCEWTGSRLRYYPLFQEFVSQVFETNVASFIEQQDQKASVSGYGRMISGLFLATNLRASADLSDAFVDEAWACLKATPPADNMLPRFRQLWSAMLEFMADEIHRQNPLVPRPQYSAMVRERKLDGYRKRLPRDWNWLPFELAAWGEELATYQKEKISRREANMLANLRHFAKFLIELGPECPAGPADFQRRHVIRRDGSPSITLIEYLKKPDFGMSRLSIRRVGLEIRRFFDEWHDRELPGDQWRNPIQIEDLPPPLAPAAKSDKEAMPARIVRLAKEIITRNDFEWPKSLRADYVEWMNPEAGQLEQVWCPARAFAILILFILPIRSVQVRLLDSGEGDELIYDHAREAFVPNHLPTATPGRAEGCIRLFVDGELRKDIIGLWINTNKTTVADPRVDKGYGIPWSTNELRWALDHLRRWQIRHNPMHRPLSRDELLESELRPSEALTGSLPSYYYLFRDPVTSVNDPHHPVTKSRLDVFFRLLMAEVEKELQADDPAITLVWRNDTGTVTKSLFSLHSLRVTGITHFMKAGVPIQVLAEFVAGHATILMTLHYAKFGPNYISETVERASRAIAEGEDEEWADWLAELVANSPESVGDYVAANSEDAIQQLADTRPGLWSIQLDGICPTGKSMCHVGGPNKATNMNAYEAVPGGPRNCPRCRFFLTGDVFLHGQVIAFNNHVFAVSELVSELDRLRKSLAQLKTSGADKRRVAREEDKIDGIEIELDEMLVTLQARYHLIEKSRALLHRKSANGVDVGSLLALGGQPEFEYVVEQTTSDFDLLEFVAQSAEIFPEQAVPSVKLRKGRIMDAFLRRNGYEAFLYALSEDEALVAANKMSRFLCEKAGRDGLRKLVTGEETMKALGIAFDPKAFVSAPLDLSSLMPQKAPAMLIEAQVK